MESVGGSVSKEEAVSNDYKCPGSHLVEYSFRGFLYALDGPENNANQQHLIIMIERAWMRFD
jgi:hypothetical protein